MGVQGRLSPKYDGRSSLHEHTIIQKQFANQHQTHTTLTFSNKYSHQGNIKVYNSIASEVLQRHLRIMWQTWLFVLWQIKTSSNGKELVLSPYPPCSQENIQALGNPKSQKCCPVQISQSSHLHRSMSPLLPYSTFMVYVRSRFSVYIFLTA